jgi:hypothetical protein
MAMELAPYMAQQFFDNDGEPLAGGLIYSYEGGTDTAKATYTDSGGGTPNANPVVLDSNGRCNIFLTTGSYKFIIKTSAGVTLETKDLINSSTGTLSGTGYYVSRFKSGGYGLENSTIYDNGSTTAIGVASPASTYRVEINGTVALWNKANDVNDHELIFRKQRGATAVVARDGDNLGTMRWYGNNDAATPETIQYASIASTIFDASDGTEAGELLFYFAGVGTGGRALFVESGSAGSVAEISRSGLSITRLGGGLLVTEGTNATMGTATLVGGAATVSTTKVTASSRIFLTSQANGGTPGFLRVTARTAATSFVVTSSSSSDTSTVAWIIIEPVA